MLRSWTAGECDKSTEPYHLVNRITHQSISHDTLLLSVNFSENCCTKFEPSIHYQNDTLSISLYDLRGDQCGCDCCFSLDLVMTGLKDLSFTTLFKGKKIVLSNDPYPLVPITYDLYQGDTINRTGKYGGQVGKWMRFYKNGKVESISFRNNVLFDAGPLSEWRKSFSPEGKLVVFERKDSVEHWYDNGMPQRMKYTTYENGNKIVRETRFYANGSLASKEVTCYYAPENYLPNKYSIGQISSQVLLSEEYYSTGHRKSFFRNDTLLVWYDNGVVKRHRLGDTAVEFYPNGKLMTREKHWSTKSPEGEPLHNMLYTGYHENGKIKSKHLVRDEADNIGIAPHVQYYWEWNNRGKRIRKPEHWKGKIPE